MANDNRSAARARPLSPDLQIYRWPVTMATSIVHRGTGLALIAGTLLVTWWLTAVASGDSQFLLFSAVARSPVGQVVLFAFAWSLAFHLLNGVRHLAWDLGYGFSVPTANRTSVLVVIVSFLAALAAFAYAYSVKGLRL